MKPRCYEIHQVCVLRGRVDVLETVVEECAPQKDCVPESKRHDGHRQNDALILVEVRKVHRLDTVKIPDSADENACRCQDAVQNLTEQPRTVLVHLLILFVISPA